MDPANYKGAMPTTGNEQRLMNITFTYIHLHKNEKNTTPTNKMERFSWGGDPASLGFRHMEEGTKNFIKTMV